MAKFQDKERILKATRDKQEVTYKGAPIRLAADFSMETIQARRERQKYSKKWEPEASNQDYFTQQGSQSRYKAK